MVEGKKIGAILWTDLTVADAVAAQEFYTKVVGWVPQGLDMSGYQDFMMNSPSTSEPVAGICHARGGNANLPPVWLLYFGVENLDSSLEHCQASGGKQVGELRKYGENGRFAVIQDPSGAFCALFQEG